MKKAGSTLVELIIYMGLLSILLLVLTQTFTSIIQARLESESSSALQQDGNYIITKLTYDISQAQSITRPSAFGIMGAPVALQLNIGGASYTYAVTTGKLQLTSPLGTDDINGYNTTVSNFQITRIGNGTAPQNSDNIKVNFNLTSSIIRSSGQETKDYEITVAPR